MAQMTPLSFQPAFDPYHAVFRILRLRSVVLSAKPIHYDHLRILDYYLMFPSRMTRIRVQPKHRGLRNRAMANAGGTPYEQQPDARSLFNRMKPFQAVAIQGLASRKYLDPILLANNEVAFVDRTMPAALEDRVEAANSDANAVIQFLGALATEYELSGVGGLKDRSGLLEFRYDAI